MQLEQAGALRIAKCRPLGVSDSRVTLSGTASTQHSADWLKRFRPLWDSRDFGPARRNRGRCLPSCGERLEQQGDLESMGVKHAVLGNPVRLGSQE